MKTYLRHKIFNVIEVKELIALEYLDFEGKYKDYVERHDFWELCYVENGVATLCCEGVTKQLTKGETVLIAPNCSHSYYAQTGNKNRAFVICFESSSQTLKALSGVCFSVRKEESDCLNKIIEECKNTFYMNENDLLEIVPLPNFGGQQAILIHLEYLLIRLIRRLSAEENQGIVFLKGEEFYAELSDIIIEFFHEHIREKLTLEDVCNKVNYSRSFLCRTFKAQTGETLFSCFNRLKIEEAKKMLKETDYSAASISRELGFSEEKYFCSLFKKWVGVSPITYREQNKNK